jgi:MFS family permease
MSDDVVASTPVPSPPVPPSPAERRIRALGLSPETAIALVGVLIVLGSDAQSLSLIPLTGQLQSSYGLSPSQAAWAISASAIAGAAVSPTMVRLGDRFGMRGLIILGLMISTVGSLITALAPTSGGFVPFIIGRALLGFSAALPLVFVLLRLRAGSAARTNRSMAFMTAATGLGIATSYLLSGIIIQVHGTVRAVFWVTTILGAVTIVLAWTLIPDSAHRERTPLDYLGSALVGGGLVCVVLAVTQGSSWGWTSSSVLALFAVGGLLLVVWYMWERNFSYPLINVRLISNRTALPAFLALGLIGLLGISTSLTTSTFVQMPKQLYGLSATVLQTAFVLIPISLLAMIFAPIGAMVITRIGTRITMIVPAILLAGDFIFLAYNHTEWWQYIIANCVWGIAFAFLYTAVNSAYLNAARPTQSATFQSAAGIVVTAFAGVGPAIYVAILTSKLLIIPNPQAPTHPVVLPSPDVFRPMWWTWAIIAAVIALLGLIAKKPVFGGKLETANSEAVAEHA